MRIITEQEAYISIRPDGFVDGACFTQSEDAKRWVKEMQDAGMTVEIRDRVEAKRLLFTHMRTGILLA